MIPLAILGAGCNLPGAATLQEFWDNLRHGRGFIRTASKQDWGVEPSLVIDPHPGTLDRISSAAMAVAAPPSLSATGFCTPLDLSGLGEDFTWPLQVCRDALTDAGLRPDLPDARCGLILGHYSWAITAQTVGLIRPFYDRAIADALGPLAIETGFSTAAQSASPTAARNGMLSKAIVTTLARAFGLGGPAYAIDAACATFSFALKLAAQHIESGAVDRMIVVAANASDPLFLAYGLSAVHALSAGGQGRPFDAQSSGLTPGQGAVAFVVARADAQAPKCYGIIRSIGLSSDGRGQHLTAPKAEGQLQACRRAYDEAGVEPATVGFVECHATGTAVGDRAELELLARLYGAQIPPAGAVKSNIGHLMTASSGAALLKTVLAMQAGEIPPTIAISDDLAKSLNIPADIPKQSMPWPQPAGMRRAAINAFGFGGTNAHLIVDDAATASEPPADGAKAACPLAIVGMDACFGPWPDLAAFAAANLAGARGFRDLPTRRWRGFETDPAILDALDCGEKVPQGGYIESFSFDPLHFRMPPKDVDHLNPQQLLLLKVADGALSDAGIAPGGRVAVVVAMAMEFDVHLMGERWSLESRVQGSCALDAGARALAAEIKDAVRAPPEPNDFLAYVGNLMASRVAAQWDFSGPAFTVGGGESGVVQAIEIARNLLSTGEAEAVLVGAVDLAGGFENFAMRHMMEPGHANGEPRASFGFDEAFAGWRTADGAGAIVLTRPDSSKNTKAYALIRGLSIHRPFAGAQDKTSAPAIAALSDAGLTAGDIGYIEVVARGTAEHDRAEMAGLAAIYGAGADQSVALGSASALFGHAGVAACMASIVRAALAVNSAFIPATPDWTGPKAQADQRSNAFYVPLTSQPWLAPRNETAAAVHICDPEGVSAHAVLAAPDAATGRWHDCTQMPFIVPLNAANGEALRARLHAVVQDVEAGKRAEEIEAAAIAAHKTHGPGGVNACLVAPHAGALADEATRLLRDIPAIVQSGGERRSLRGSYVTAAPLGPDGAIAFVYSGMYGAYPGLCRNTLQFAPALRDELASRFGDPGAAFAERLLFPRSLHRLSPAALEQADDALSADGESILRIGVIASFLHTRLLGERFGLTPSLAFGYSLGEISMLFGADVWKLSDDWREPFNEISDTLARLGADRGQVNVVVMASPDDILHAIGDAQDVCLSQINSPKECVLVGREEACARIINALNAESLQLPSRLSLHTPAAAAERDRLQRCFTMPLSAPPPWRLQLGGAAVEAWTPEVVGAKIAADLAARLDFPASVHAAYAAKARLFIEMGPGHSCTRWIGDCLNGKPHVAIAVARRGLGEAAALGHVAATLAAHNYPIEFEKIIGRRRPAASPHARAVILGGSAIPKRLAQLAAEHQPKAHSAMPIRPMPGPAAPATAVSAPPVSVPQNKLDAVMAIAAAQSRAHSVFLQQRIEMVENLGGHKEPSRPSAISRTTPQPIRVAPERAAVCYDEADILEIAEGRISNIFGADYAPVDDMPRRVRVPGQPFTAMTRVTHIEGTRGNFDRGRIVTEFDIPRPAWFGVGGHSASMLALDAQGVLFLLSYLGVDLESKGLRRFRWLDANITMRGDYPHEGDIVRYDITLKRSFRDGDSLMLFFDMTATASGRPLLENHDCCVGFFTDADLARSQGIKPYHRIVRSAPGAAAATLLQPPRRVLGRSDLLMLAKGDLSILSPAHAVPGNPHLRLPPAALHMVDRIVELRADGGLCGLGSALAERVLDPSHWAIRAHFKDDVVFPGPCMLEGTAQVLKVFALAIGLHQPLRGARFEPVLDRSYRLKFREQIIPCGQTFVYRVDIVEIGQGMAPYLIADVEFEDAGRTIGRIEGIGLRLAQPDSRT